MEQGLGIEGLAEPTVIGSGGFGTVYRAWDETFLRWVAVKVVHESDEDTVRRFGRELAIMGQLSDHTNVITPFRAGTTVNGAPYVVMEYVSGGSLADVRAERGTLAWRDALALMVPICDALSYAHSRDIVHRDVKPANILLAGDVPKLTDFGIAAFGAAPVSMSGFSLAYSPPETFAEGRDQRDHRSDIYSVAATIHTLVTGRCPYQIDGEDSPSAQIVRIAEHPIPRLAVGPEELRWLLFRCLAKTPTDRPGSMADLTGTLRRLAAAPGDDGPTIRLVPDPAVVEGDNGTPPALARVAEAEPPPPEPAPAAGDGPGGDGPGREKSPIRGDARVGGDREDRRGHAGDGAGRTPLATTDVDRRPLEQLPGHRASVLALAVLADGRLASGGADGLLRVADPADRSVAAVAVDNRCDAVWSVAPLDQRRVVCAADSRVRIIDVTDPAAKPVVLRHDRGPVLALTVIGEGRVASAGAEGGVLIWHPDHPYRDQVRYVGDGGTVTALAPIGDGRLVSGGKDGSVRIWHPDHLADPAVVLSTHRRPVKAVVATPDELVVSCALDGSVRLADPDRPDDSCVLSHDSRRIQALTAAGDGLVLGGGVDGSVVAWDLLRPRDPARPVITGLEPVVSLAVCGDGRIAVGCADGIVRLVRWRGLGVAALTG